MTVTSRSILSAMINITAIFIVHVAAQTQSSCDVCSCFPNSDAPIVISCGQALNTTSLPTDFANTTQLLIVDGGNISTIKATDFRGMTALTQLTLTNANIQTVEVGAFTNISLTDLNLANNQIMTVEGTLFNGLNQLSHLDIQGNKISMLPDSVCSELSALTSLDAQRNNIKNIRPKVFEGCTNINHIDLSSNELTEIAEDAFTGLDNLASLDISGNNLTTFYAAWLVNKGSGINFVMDASTWYCTLQLRMEYDNMNKTHPQLIGCEADQLCPTCINFGGKRLSNITMDELTTTAAPTTQTATTKTKSNTDSMASTTKSGSIQQSTTNKPKTTSGSSNTRGGSLMFLVLGFTGFLWSLNA